jgi:hypothetical protein
VSSASSASSSSSDGLLSVYVLVDPLTLGGQRGAAVVELLSQHLRLPVTGDYSRGLMLLCWTLDDKPSR